MTPEELKEAFIAALTDDTVVAKLGRGSASTTTPSTSTSTSTASGKNLTEASDVASIDTAASNETPGIVSAVETAKKYSNIGTATLGIAGNIINETLQTSIKVLGSAQKEMENLRPEFAFLRDEIGGVSLAALQGKEPMGAFAGSLLNSYENVVRLATGAEGAQSSIKLLGDPDLLGGVNPLEAIFKNGHEAAKSYAEMIVSISKDVPNLAMKMNEAQKEEALVLKKTMQLSDQDLTALLKKQYAFSGETGTAVIQDIANVSVALSKKVGIAQQSLQYDIIELKKDTETFGDIGVDAAGRIAASLGQLGLDVQTFKGMVSGFLDFDSAASKMGELSALFGIQMDAMEMTYLANEDQEEFLQRMREQVLDSGVDVENMSNVRARALAKQMNMSVDQMKMFMRTGEQAVDQAGLESITDQAASMDGMTTAMKEIGNTTAAANRTAEDYTKNLQMQLAYAEGIRKEVALTQGEYEKMSQDVMKIDLPPSAIANFQASSKAFREMGTKNLGELVETGTTAAQSSLDVLSDGLNELMEVGLESANSSVILEDIGITPKAAAEIGGEVSNVIASQNTDIEKAIADLQGVDEKAKNDLYEMIAKQNQETIDQVVMEMKGQKIEVSMTVDGEVLTKSIINQGGKAGNKKLTILDQDAEPLTSQNP